MKDIIIRIINKNHAEFKNHKMAKQLFVKEQDLFASFLNGFLVTIPIKNNSVILRDSNL